MRKTLLAIAVLALAALAVAGCGSDSSGGYGSGDGSVSRPAPPSPETSDATIVSLASVPKVGLVLVNSKGLTLYDFHKDKGGKSACYGSCASVWPPLTTEGAPQPSNGTSASKLGTTNRKDGTVQVTYDGHPLYTYTADTKPGEANGNDFSSFGAQWYALKANGEEAGD